MSELYRTIQNVIEPTQEQYDCFCKLYNYLNQELFNGELSPCFLSFSSKFAHAFGFFTAKRWYKENQVIHEISMNPLKLGNIEPIELVQTLAHEMVHLWQQDFGTVPRGGYHDKQWANKMEAIGLMPSDTNHPGGKRTGQNMGDYPIPDGKFIKVFEQMPKEFIFPWFSTSAFKYKPIKIGSENNATQTIPEVVKQLIANNDPAVIKPSNKNKTKYTCECGNNVWGKPNLYLHCNECNTDFSEE